MNSNKKETRESKKGVEVQDSNPVYDTSSFYIEEYKEEYEYESRQHCPPEEMAAYKEVQADLPDRLVTMAEEDQKHINFVEKVETISDALGAILGILSALGLGVSAVYWGAQVAISGAEITGGIISTSGLAGIIGTFVYGTRRQNGNNNNNDNADKDNHTYEDPENVNPKITK